MKRKEEKADQELMLTPEFGLCLTHTKTLYVGYYSLVKFYEFLHMTPSKFLKTHFFFRKSYNFFYMWTTTILTKATLYFENYKHFLYVSPQKRFST